MFNIRVYGILVNEEKKVLVSDELIRGSYITKFPGGGLEFGEGTRDCLQREFMEEMNIFIPPIIFNYLLLIPRTRLFQFTMQPRHWKKLQFRYVPKLLTLMNSK
jgi:8-oxo-dGTP pyrophosphatase MutT (NUDIX family)